MYEHKPQKVHKGNPQRRLAQSSFSSQLGFPKKWLLAATSPVSRWINCRYSSPTIFPLVNYRQK